MFKQLKVNWAIAALLLSVFLMISQAHASTVTVIEDSWVDWPGYSSTKGDEHGNPKLDKIRVTVADNNVLEKIEILWRPNSENNYTRIKFDSLFINSYDTTTTNSDWDDWDYFVHDGGTEHTYTNSTPLGDLVSGNVAGDGLWTVQANYQYTMTASTRLRENNPDGIDADYLENRQDFSSNITWDPNNGVLTYDLASFGISAENGLFVAYAPYCANDVIGGQVSAVPIPASAYLFITGFLGLLGYARNKRA
jgi:hypothetical protein